MDHHDALRSHVLTLALAQTLLLCMVRHDALDSCQHSVDLGFGVEVGWAEPHHGRACPQAVVEVVTAGGD